MNADEIRKWHRTFKRPDGAKLKWQMYTWIWSASKKKGLSSNERARTTQMVEHLCR